MGKGRIYTALVVYKVDFVDQTITIRSPVILLHF